MTLLIKNGRVLDPANNRDEVTDIYVEEGIITEVGQDIEKQADRVIDAAGLFVMPGLIDLHVHLREPGLEYKETIETGCAAAARGGYTTIFAMPNTKPVADCAAVIRQVEEKAKKVTGVHVHQIGSLTKGQKGKELADLADLAEAGCIAFSEDGKSVMDSLLCRQAMEITSELELPIFAHCEDIKLVDGGVMNRDQNAVRLGLPGISNAVEDIIAARDILLSKETGARLHLCHCSTEDSVKMVRNAKEAGLHVTAEVCPHHFSMSSDEIMEDHGRYKMNPPLRQQADVKALREGLRDNVMDVISTDHAPHSEEEKNQSMRKAPFGIVGLETAVPLTVTHLLEEGYLTPLQMAEKMSYHPAMIAGIDRGTLGQGKMADIVIIDPTAEYAIDPGSFASKGKSTPFAGKIVRGKVCYTIADGILIYQQDK